MCDDCTCNCGCDKPCNCDCDNLKCCKDLVCFNKYAFDSVKIENLCAIKCLQSYITETKIISFCKKPVIKISYAVEIFYTTHNCEEKTYILYGSVLCMCLPPDFDLCSMRATIHSTACDNSCDNINVKTVVKICG